MSTRSSSPGGSSAWIYLAGALAAAGVVGGVMAVAAGRQAETRVEAERRHEATAAGPRVSVVTASTSPPERRIELQAEARPFAQVTLYAKVSGYIRTILVDKGDKVRRGQLIAIIESPELDSQLVAAQADLKFKRANAARALALKAPGVVSARDADLAESSADVAAATVAQLATQKRYERIVAPFDGTVTARFVDPGALVQSATAAQTGALPLVTVGTTDRLRVSAYLDQRDAAWVKVGDAAEVSVTDRPAVRVKGTVARSAGQLDPRTRTMLTEIDVDNRGGAIVPGSYVHVSLKATMPPLVQVPASALVLRDRKPFIAVVEGEAGGAAVVRYRPVVVGEDDGATARIRSGLSAGERVAVDLGDTLADGARVQPVSADPPKPQGGAPAGGKPEESKRPTPAGAEHDAGKGAQPGGADGPRK